MPQEFCSLLTLVPRVVVWALVARLDNCSQIVLGYENGRAMVVYTGAPTWWGEYRPVRRYT